ncbi:MAG: DNA starvation/stationary phase protection protein [Fimbriimonadaceae bacterium]|nr:DNA starvation/stationary phase protection protein [Fimbriimonadaceae bacterium]QYK56953.1 MAG: DNA starvation/stationary phase protection protein [Fimbriimonadaceae bacterium]
MNAKKISDALNGVLADTYVLFTKTQNYHWNVVGPNFHSLHEMFEEQYTELFAAIDEIAEQIRQLGVASPGTMADFLRLASISEGDSSLSAGEMVADLVESHDRVIARVHACAHVADKEDDESTEDLMTRRLNAHRKTVWMLSATLGHPSPAQPAEPAALPAPEEPTAVPPRAKPAKSDRSTTASKSKKKAPKAMG